MNRIRSFALLSLCATVLASGCAGPQLATPTGFAANPSDKAYDYRASDGEGVVLAVRRHKNQLRGDLEFWTSALDVRLQSAGYEATERRSITSADGHTGTQLRYTLDDGGRALDFWVTLFVTKRHVVVVEAGGDQQLLAPKASTVQEAIASVEIG